MIEIPEIQAGDAEILRRKCGQLAEQLRIARIQIDADGEVIAEQRAALKEARDIIADIERAMKRVGYGVWPGDLLTVARAWLAAHKEE